MTHAHAEIGFAFMLAASLAMPAGAARRDRHHAARSRQARGNSARVEPAPNVRGAIRVTFQPAEWPNVKFPAPSGRAWDWSSQGFLLLGLRTRADGDRAGHPDRR